MTLETRIAPFGSWRSPISGELAAHAARRIGGISVDDGDVYWVEGRPAQGGRNVVLRWCAGQVEEITSASHNVRTRVHEYGGGAFAVAGGIVIFANDADQRLYVQRPGASAEPLVPAGPFRYADLIVDQHRRRIVCVREDHSRAGQDPTNTLVAVPLGGGEAHVLAAGADFYAFPRLSPDGTRLAYLAWQHPAMPWQSTELFAAPLTADGGLGSARRIAGGAHESIFQPDWSSGGDLSFVSDRSGWWNLYRHRAGQDERLCARDADFGAALWVFGLGTYAWVGPNTLVCTFQSRGTWHLAVLDAATGKLDLVQSPLTEIGYLRGSPGRAVFVGASPAEPPGIYELVVDRAGAAMRLLHRPSELAIDEELVSRPEPITFASKGGATAHGLYYPPRNPAFEGLPEEKPPLIVMSHGGPTAAASTALNVNLQYWTSRGFAVLDVNYRGSTGYGRAFRDALDGAWGVADVDDCVAGARDLVDRGLADRARLAIRGGSAGGYTTLAALTFRDLFATGASHYGVSDLEALARDTHKFEKHYLDSLIGPYPAQKDLYRARSPIHAVDRLSRPMIFFQGLQDKVVPPDQAARMALALKQKGIAVEYVTFADEQHGFRRAENIARALEAELAFYGRVFGIIND